MGERKVVNKYYPLDFNPAKIPRQKQLKNQQMRVRMMLLCSIRYKTCCKDIYKGTKFNSLKETVDGETYLGIKVLRFYFKCTNCSTEISIKTDPKNSDYVVEFGATQNFESWCAWKEEAEKLKRKREDEEIGGSMKILEDKTLDSKREINILDNLEEVKSIKARRANVSVDTMLEALQRSGKKEEKEEEEKMNADDEALVRSIFEGESSKGIEIRIADEDIDDDDEGLALKFPTSKK